MSKERVPEEGTEEMAPRESERIEAELQKLQVEEDALRERKTVLTNALNAALSQERTSVGLAPRRFKRRSELSEEEHALRRQAREEGKAFAIPNPYPGAQTPGNATVAVETLRAEGTARK